MISILILSIILIIYSISMYLIKNYIDLEIKDELYYFKNYEKNVFYSILMVSIICFLLFNIIDQIIHTNLAFNIFQGLLAISAYGIIYIKLIKLYGIVYEMSKKHKGEKDKP